MLQLLSMRRGRPLALNVIMARWHKLIESVRDPYRPELYYMRGPGPKWYAKHRSEAGSVVL
jgi:hypothetical protein